MKVKEVKKYYISPVVEVVSCVPASALLDGSLGVDNSGQHGEDDDFFEGEAADEYRGSWEGIWDNM